MSPREAKGVAQVVRTLTDRDIERGAKIGEPWPPVDAPEPEPPRTTIADRYKPIDVHSDNAPAWPAVIPPLTAIEAERAARRLWRFALGETFAGEIRFATGNRYTWAEHSRTGRHDTYGSNLRVNPGEGWKEFVHSLSHLFVLRANYGQRVKPHEKFHARFEAKLVREVIRRGWLDGKLRDAEPAGEPAEIAPLDAKREKQRAELAKIDAAVERWERKAKRAKNALAKLAKRRRYYAKALGE